MKPSSQELNSASRSFILSSRVELEAIWEYPPFVSQYNSSHLALTSLTAPDVNGSELDGRGSSYLGVITPRISLTASSADSMSERSAIDSSAGSGGGKLDQSTVPIFASCKGVEAADVGMAIDTISEGKFGTAAAELVLDVVLKRESSKVDCSSKQLDNEKLGTELAVGVEAGVAVPPNPVKELAGAEDFALTADAVEAVAADDEPTANGGNAVEVDVEAEPPADVVDALVEGGVENRVDDATVEEDCEDEEDGVNEKNEVVVDVAVGVGGGDLELEVGLANDDPVEAGRGDDVEAELKENMPENEGVVLAVVAVAAAAGGKHAAEAVARNKDAPDTAAEDDGVPNRSEAAVGVELDDEVDAAPNGGDHAPEDDEPELALGEGAGVPNREAADDIANEPKENRTGTATDRSSWRAEPSGRATTILRTQPMMAHRRALAPPELPPPWLEQKSAMVGAVLPFSSACTGRALY
ncbi:hypothetical protein NL676_011879 [Syzygium grande]|nr:hypothetical protein NL676_011879 [Syzygium grande]